MEELFKIANQYYKNQESFKAYGGFKNIYLWATLVLGALFIWFSLSNLIDITNKEKYASSFFMMLLFEGLFLYSFYILMKSKKKYFLEFTKKETGDTFENIDDAKVANLKRYFVCEQTVFSDMAEKIRKMSRIDNELSKHKNKIELLFSFIYSEGSKARILTLFVLACSIVTILTAAAGQDINYLIGGLLDSNFKELFYIYLFLLALSSTLLIGISYLFKFMQKILIFISLFFLKDERPNTETLKYLINDLNYYHIFKKDEKKKLIIVEI